jgi:DNA-binding CsgD family transcriptional regulator
MEDVYWNSEHTYAWIKNANGRYSKCSEGFAVHAGLDSPASIIGKKDSELIWKSALSTIMREDKIALAGQPVCNAHRIVTTHKGTKTILVNKYAKDRYLTGNATDITGHVLMDQRGRWNFKTGSFEVNGLELTKKEVEVVRLLLIGQSSKLIAAHLNIHEKTVEQRLESLKRKFKCNSKVALVQRLHYGGLSYLAMNKDKLLMP